MFPAQQYSTYAGAYAWSSLMIAILNEGLRHVIAAFRWRFWGTLYNTPWLCSFPRVLTVVTEADQVINGPTAFETVRLSVPFDANDNVKS